MVLDDVDGYIRARDFLPKLGNASRRALYTWVRTGKFPQPDRPSSRKGERDLWLESTVRRGIASFAKGRVKSSA